MQTSTNLIDDEGEHAVNAQGDDIGCVVEVRAGVAYDDPA